MEPTLQREHRDNGDVVILGIRGRTELNLLGRETMLALGEVLHELADDEAVRAIVLRSALPSARGWIGGADLRELAVLDRVTAESFIRAVHGVCEALRRCSAPALAAIEGYCLGAGLEIAAACDIRIAAAGASFGMPEVRVGVPSVVEAALLPQLIGWGKTRELLLRGHVIEATEAHRIGLIEQLASATELEHVVAQIVDDILAGGPYAITTQKRLINYWEEVSLGTAIEAGVAAFRAAYETNEPQDYCARFFARKPTKS